MKWPWNKPKLDPMEYHYVGQFGTINAKPCGPWRYLGQAIWWKVEEELEKRGIVITEFRICTSCGECQSYAPNRPKNELVECGMWYLWESTTFNELMANLRKAEDARRIQQVAEKKYQKKLERERATHDVKMNESRMKALEWLKGAEQA